MITRCSLCPKPQQRKTVTVEDVRDDRVRDAGQSALADDVICPAQPLDRVGTTGKGVVCAEEEFVGDVVLLSGDQHRVELPRSVVESRDIRVDVRVLPYHD